jgi:acetyltransferase-like isoleucine patch superfamily enzyme
VTPILSANIRVRVPDHFAVAEGAIVDDYCYFSTRVEIGRWSHVAAGCHVAGGPARTFRLGDFSSLSAGVKIWCTSDDFVNDVVMILPPGLDDVKEHLVEGDVTLGRCTAVGSNSVVMPDNVVPEGTVIGALSFVPPRFAFEPWSVYAGTPVRRVRARNRDAVLAQVAKIEAHLARHGGASSAGGPKEGTP